MSVPSHDNPQVTLTRHAEQIASLQVGLKDLNADMHEMGSSLQRGMNDLSKAVSEQVGKVTERMTNKNPMVYIGLGSLALTVIITGAGLTFFTINSQIKPIETHVQSVSSRVERNEDRIQTLTESSIRAEEHVKMLEQRALEERAKRNPATP